jgi:hypothetical protein
LATAFAGGPIFAGGTAFFAAGPRGGTALRGEPFVATAFVAGGDLAAVFFDGAGLLTVFLVAGLLALVAIIVPS